MDELSGFSVLLVDDHSLFREGLTLALRLHAPQMRIESVGSFDDAVGRLGRSPADVDLVLLDYRLPGQDGLACAQVLRQKFPQVACALMSGSDVSSLPELARRAGLVGYFAKSLDVMALVQGLARLASGASVFEAPAFVAEGAFASTFPGELTERQREVLRMVAAGSTNKEIAQVLQIAPHTVKNHLAQIFARLGASNRAQAVAMLNAASGSTSG